jgi:ADP-ribosylglycohydrolase
MYLTNDDYYDRVYGCWQGKSCGGTLGAPLERIWGEEALFDVSWYPSLPEGGIPNDDLELQLIWLQALEDRGLDITARDLADYWLDCIVYNYDEYGLNKTNLRKGLAPPLSGKYNNWFRDCMGCPIRSEIWACIAPGLPNVAARYAYEDAIVDHAGGESVYGEMFNAAMQSIAFVKGDPHEILEAGLAFIPEGCLTAKAIRLVMQEHLKGTDWKEVRNLVLKAVPSPNAQYSPINLGFQTIGWLYGEDFGDAMCKAVNCGYDTDCTGATVGATLGIIAGRKGLPEKWTRPLSDTITTSLESGGIRNLRLPKNLDDLTKRVLRIGSCILAREGASEPDLRVSDETKALWDRPSNVIRHDLRSMAVTVEYPDGPAIGPGEERVVEVSVVNRRSEAATLTARIVPCEGWSGDISERRRSVAPGAEGRWQVSLRPNLVSDVRTSNVSVLALEAEGQPAPDSVPIVIVGGYRWLVSPRVEGGLDTVTAWEGVEPTGPGNGWRPLTLPTYELPLESLFGGRDGAILLRHWVWLPEPRTLRIGFSGTVPFRLWLNGEKALDVPSPGKPRPNYGGDGRAYADRACRAGWNAFLVKAVRQGAPAEGHFVLSDVRLQCAGLWDALECRFPWEGPTP